MAMVPRITSYLGQDRISMVVRTPLSSLSILLMDGVPVPFFAAIYQGENGAGIKHLVDLNHDKGAELLISSYDENVSDSWVGVFCSGHWTTQAYRFKGLGAEEIRGPLAKSRFHLFTIGATAARNARRRKSHTCRFSRPLRMNM